MPVVDASVALKWFVEEPDSPAAISIREAHVYKENHIVAPTSELAQAAVRWAARHKLTFYDALYVAIAHELDTELITADRQLIRRTGAASFIRLLR